jgi:hypothetical protein
MGYILYDYTDIKNIVRQDNFVDESTNIDLPNSYWMFTGVYIENLLNKCIFIHDLLRILFMNATIG